MALKWNVTIAGGTVLGLGLGGFAAADDLTHTAPDNVTMRASMSAPSPLSAVFTMKHKGGYWQSLGDSPAGLDSAASANTWSADSSAASPNSPDSPPSPDSWSPDSSSASSS